MLLFSLVYPFCTTVLHWWLEHSLLCPKFVAHEAWGSRYVLIPPFKFYISKFNLFRMFVNFIFAKRFPKRSFLKLKKSFYVGLLEAAYPFTSLLVEIKSSTLESPHTPLKQELFKNCCCYKLYSINCSLERKGKKNSSQLF